LPASPTGRHVGFLQHGGEVADDTTVKMSFKTGQINDLLKSMVLEDLDGGTVAAVSYASGDLVAEPGSHSPSGVRLVVQRSEER
jgi:hypothetical protein